MGGGDCCGTIPPAFWGPPSPQQPAQLRRCCSAPPGNINAEEIQRLLQKIKEQYTSTLKNPR